MRHVRLLRADNPSPYTLSGTNTWVVADGGEVVVIDPGPALPAHLDAIARTVGDRRVVAVVLTHGHLDHSEGAAELAAWLDAPVRGADPAFCEGTAPLRDGERLRIGEIDLDVLTTPGHSRDSVCFVADVDHVVFTGDTVLGAGSSLVAWPDGNLAAYLDSLERLAGLIAARNLLLVAPGHGPLRRDAARLVDHYRTHRSERLDQVREAVREGARDADAVFARVYGREVSDELAAAARTTLLAQLDFLYRRAELPADFAVTWLDG
ncbi:MAG: MBL fold metallo-hydrolase [Acidothermus sp.]|nr:MBL fold metallo-hydrolase [Acidothermus sp.]